ncbi:MAG TPA: WG repeat-containing protein [Acetivibrio sp.]|uniref:WG repeat-containing protein n=1 Tax=Acetivibrio sp. TaxID=1872092 RepID=UPI002C8B9E59|nr:WG repeat-containing protein [Acetivibrio sp.]HOM03537.1 WG repeat-containing protein [Acetivibrio sp.]
MKKQLLSTLLVFVLVLSLNSITMLAAEPKIENLTYYDKVYAFSEGMSKVVKNDKYGFMDQTGKVVIDFTYDYAEDFCEGFAAVSTDGFWNPDGGYVEGKWGFIDKTGKVIVPIIYDKVCNFSEGLAAVIKDGKLGFVDTAGEAVIPPAFGGGMYEEFYFSSGLAVVTTGDFGTPDFLVIDKTGNLAFDFKYDYARLSSYSEGLLAVGVGGDWGIGGPYYWARSYSGGKYGFIDTNGKEVVSPIYDYVDDFNEGIAVVCKDDKWGAIDKDGNVVVPIIYPDISRSSEGFICIRNDEGKWGYVDYTGNVVIDFKFDLCNTFREGFVTNSINGEWGTLDATGKTVIPFKYNNLWNFSEGLVRVRTVEGGKWGYMDNRGNIVIEPVYQAATDFSDGVAIVKKDDKFGVIFKTSIPFTATPTSSTVLVNGSPVAFDAYSINGNNYFKLRDLAYVLNGTGKQFEVTWDSVNKAINLIPDKSYTVSGGEMATGSKNNATAYPSSATVYINGKAVELTAYTINGYNYFKLRDIGKAFDFGVIWDGTANTIRIDTSGSYTE